ncbi:hypothetical protein ACH5RR_040308 [Cinchona calisaya]|uniref:Uncharacterized protein n=1 Tax=Cinchona calisaya TaxID=153742 RepID=A0ABD2XTB5_9GENT
MVSLPKTDGDEDSASVEVFRTPPEHHWLSCSSSQEGFRQLPESISAADVEIEGSDGVEKVGIEDGCGKNEVNFDLGKRGGNLGFSESEGLEGGDGVLDGKKESEKIEGFDIELERFSVVEGESNEPVLKKIRVLEKKTAFTGKREIIENVDDFVDDDYQLGEEEEEESKGNDGVTENGEMQKNGKGISDGENDTEGGMEKVEYCDHDEGVGLDGCENSVRLNGGLAVEGYEEGIIGNEIHVVQKNGKGVIGFSDLEEIEKFKYNGNGGIDHPGVENGGTKSLLTNVDFAVEASVEERIRNNRNHEVWKNSAICRNIEEIDQFKCKGSGHGGDQSWKEVVRRRRELPISMRGKGNDAEGKERVGNVDVKNLSWKELLDALDVILGKVDDDSEDMDFLEVAKRRGITFPQPRWI